MKPSTTDQIQGKLHEVKGKVKETAGRLANDPSLAAEGQNAKASLTTTGAGHLDLRNRLQGERQRTISVRWIDNPSDIGNICSNNNYNSNTSRPNSQSQRLRLQRQLLQLTATLERMMQA